MQIANGNAFAITFSQWSTKGNETVSTQNSKQ